MLCLSAACISAAQAIAQPSGKIPSVEELKVDAGDGVSGLGDGVRGAGVGKAQEAPVAEGGDLGVGDAPGGRLAGRSTRRGAQRMNSGSGSTSKRTASISVRPSIQARAMRCPPSISRPSAERMMG